MELEEQLRDQGYKEAERQLEEAKRAVEIGRKNLAAGVASNGSLADLIADLTELESSFPVIEKALAAEYAAAVKLVDAQNDADFAAQDILERAELIAEYFDEIGGPKRPKKPAPSYAPSTPKTERRYTILCDKIHFSIP